MTTDVASRISEHHVLKPGWWVVSVREEAARRDGRTKPYSQMDVASAIGRDRNTIWRWESEGIDYFSWMGLIAVMGLELSFEPKAPPTPSAVGRPRKKARGSTSKVRPH